MATVSFRIEDSVLKDLSKVEKSWQADRSEVLRRLLISSINEWKKQEIIEILRKNKMSLEKAAESLGISLYEIINIASENDINWIGYKKGDLKKELKALGG